MTRIKITTLYFLLSTGFFIAPETNATLFLPKQIETPFRVQLDSGIYLTENEPMDMKS